jgi:hypothetical protein
MMLTASIVLMIIAAACVGASADWRRRELRQHREQQRDVDLKRRSHG